MNYGTIKPWDIANGEGVRVSVFVSGCPHHCKGCFNGELWEYDAGELFTSETVWEIMDWCSPNYISGLSVLGGEPLAPENFLTVASLCHAFKQKFPNKTIWCYTGYTFENIKNFSIMNHIDVLVDGQFVEELKDISLKFRGSSNQRIIDVKKSIGSGAVVLREDLMMRREVDGNLR